jgi:hypothetical protein
MANPRRGGHRSCAAALLLSSAIVAAPTLLAAQEGGELEPTEGTECCLYLLLPVGARATSMAGTITALQGVDGAYMNPAGLAGMDGNTFVVHHSDVGTSVPEQVDAFSLLITPWSIALAVSYQLIDNGESVVTDPFQQPTGELALRDHLVTASVGTELFAGLSAGANYKLYQQRIDCTGQCGSAESVATATAVDVGFRYQPLWHPPLALGLVFQNMSPGLQVENAEQTDPFPARVHLGAAYDVLAASSVEQELALRLTAGVQDRLREPGSPTVSVGMELDVQDAIFLRAGYAPGEGLGTGAAVGLELRYDRFDIAVARSFVTSLLETDSEPFQISFGLNF